jgi:hypothetical protein
MEDFMVTGIIIGVVATVVIVGALAICLPLLSYFKNGQRGPGA